LQRRGGRGRRVLRVERQQDDLVRPEGRHIGGRLLGQRPPVAHGDEDADLVFRQAGAQGRLQRSGLLLRLPKQRRAAAHQRIVGLGGRLPAGGNQARQRSAQNSRQTDDGRVVEEVEKERFYARLVVGTAEVEEHHGDATAAQR